MNQNAPANNSITAFSIAALVFSILSLITCCTGILPLAAGGLSILFAVLSRRDDAPFPTMSIVSVVLSSVGIALGIVITVFTIVYVILPMLTDPAAYAEMNTFYQNNYGISLDEMLGEFAPLFNR